MVFHPLFKGVANMVLEAFHRSPFPGETGSSCEFFGVPLVKKKVKKGVDKMAL